MTTCAATRTNTRIPVQLDEATFLRFVLPCLSMPKRGPMRRRNTRRIAISVAALITGNHIARVRIDDKVELTPGAVLGRFAQVSAVHLDAGAVHEDMNRPVMAGLVERYLPQLPGAA